MSSWVTMARSDKVIYTGITAAELRALQAIVLHFADSEFALFREACKDIQGLIDRVVQARRDYRDQHVELSLTRPQRKVAHQALAVAALDEYLSEERCHTLDEVLIPCEAVNDSGVGHIAMHVGDAEDIVEAMEYAVEDCDRTREDATRARVLNAAIKRFRNALRT